MRKILGTIVGAFLVLTLTAGAAYANCPPPDPAPEPCTIVDVVRAFAGDSIHVEATGAPTSRNTVSVAFLRRGASRQPVSFAARTFYGTTALDVIVPASAGRRAVTVIGTLRAGDCGQHDPSVDLSPEQPATWQ